MTGTEALKNLKEYATGITNSHYFGVEKIFAKKDFDYIEEQSTIIEKDLKALDEILTRYSNADKMGFNDKEFYHMIYHMAKERGYKIQ